MGLKLGLLQRGSTYRLKVYKHKELRKICEPNVVKTLGWWMKLHNEGCDVSSPNIVTVIKPRNMIWAGNVENVHTDLLWESLNVRDLLENLVLNGMPKRNIRFFTICGKLLAYQYGIL